MPPLPPAAGVVKVSWLYGLGQTSTALSRIFIHYSGTAPTGAQLNTFATSVRTAWTADLQSLQNNQLGYGGTSCEDLSSASGAVGNDPTLVGGTRVGGPIPGGSALMIQHLIARRYRGSKPKIFLPLGSATDITNGQVWAAAFVTACNTGWNNFITAILGAGWTGAGTLTHVNVSYFSGFTVVTNPITHRARNVPTLRGTPTVDTVTGYSVENGIASQRRRNVV